MLHSDGRISENVFLTWKKTKLGQTGELLKSLLQIRKAISFSIFWAALILNCIALCFSEDAYKTQVRIDDEPAYLDILDTAGQVSIFPMWTIQSEIKTKILTLAIRVTDLEPSFLFKHKGSSDRITLRN